MIKKLNANSDDSTLVQKINEIIGAINDMMSEEDRRKIAARKLVEDWEREDQYR